jgi:hypothetical protein
MPPTIHDLRHKDKLKTVFNFMLSMLDAVMKSLPHISFIKRELMQDKGI